MQDNRRNKKPEISTFLYGKVPPQALDVEEAILGAVMVDKSCFTSVLGIINTPDCFYADVHQKVFAAMLRLNTSGMDIDLLTVVHEVESMGNLEAVGGAYFLTKLTMGVMGSAHIETHCLIVLEKFLQREIIRISGSMINDAYESDADVPSLIARAQKEIYDITNIVSSSEPLPMSKLMREVVAESEIQKNNKSIITGVPTGFHDIDKRTSGWQKTDLIILAARPAVGKTAFSLNLGLGSALAGYPGIFFSLEMSCNQLIQRAASNYMTIELDRIKNASKMTDGEWDVYVRESGKLAQVPIYIDDTASQTVLQIRSKVFKLLNKGVPLQWIIIDYLQLIQCGANEKGQNRNGQVGGISRDLKILAKDTKLPVIALCQLSREGEANPGLTTLRDSGAIEQDADIVGFLYNGTALDTKDDTVFDMQKHRNGEVGVTLLRFTKQFQRFTEKSAISNQFPVVPDNPRTGINNNPNNFKQSDWQH